MSPAIDYNIFRNNLKKVRSVMDLSAKDLSIKAGLRQQKRVSDIEDGRGKPTLEEVFVICEILGQPIDGMLKSEMKIVYS